MGDSIRGFTNFKVDYDHSFSFFHYLSNLVIESDQADQTRPTFHEPMLASPEPLIVSHMLCDCTQHDLLHKLP